MLDQHDLLLEATPQRDSSGNIGPRNDGAGNSNAERRDAASGEPHAAPEPAWLKSLDAQPEAAAEARRWRQAALDAAALDTDYFSAAPGARAALAARLHHTDPAAFRGMLADAARILAERDPQGLADLARQLGAGERTTAPAKTIFQDAQSASGVIPSGARNPSVPFETRTQRDSSGDTGPRNDGRSAGAFPADAYRAFEAATNDDIARQVRDAIDRTLTATLPDGVADGARRRIGEDIFRDLSSTLSTDRDLSGKINELLRGWRFDAGTRQQLAGLLTGRARVALPEVARRVVSEWTSSVLASDRAKNARIESAASRRDITGGRLPEPVASSALRPRRVDYGRTSDEQILEM